MSFGHVKSPDAWLMCPYIARSWDSRKHDLERQVDSDARMTALRDCQRFELYLDWLRQEFPCARPKATPHPQNLVCERNAIPPRKFMW
jgi:hypothetical protein